MNKKKIIVSGAAAITLLAGIPAYAATANLTSTQSTGYSAPPHRVRQQIAQATFGKVSSITNTGFTLSRRGASGSSVITVGTNSDTTYKMNGTVNAGMRPQAGQTVVVMGARDSLGNIEDARSVNVMVRPNA